MHQNATSVLFELSVERSAKYIPLYTLTYNYSILLLTVLKNQMSGSGVESTRKESKKGNPKESTCGRDTKNYGTKLVHYSLHFLYGIN
jgi:hypothetical protein